MALIIHLAIAFGSIGYTTYMYMHPSKFAINITYILVAFTFLSGFVLMSLKPINMTQVCVTGLLYIGFVTFGIVAARKKLAVAESNSILR